jgi:hypothetical protein
LSEHESGLLAARLTAQQLSGVPALSPEQVVDRLLAIQAQDGRGARLSIRARSTGLTASDVDAALTDRRSLLITWLHRGTLHLVRPEDYWWLHPLTTTRLETANVRRLAAEGVSPAQADHGVEVIADQVGVLGPRTRLELRVGLETEGVPTAGQALVRLLFAASLRGHIVRGPVRGAEHCFVAVTDWLGAAPEPVEQVAALARLARRYLAGHGPAEVHDLAKWAGISLREARQGLGGIADELTGPVDGMVDLVVRPAPSRLPDPRLLGPFDPLLHGWVSRQLVMGRHTGLVTTNGLFRPFALVDGKAVATWNLAGGRVTLHPLERIGPDDLDRLEEDAVEVLRYVGLPPEPWVVQA